MPSGGLLRNPDLLFKGDVVFQREVIIQATMCAILLAISAFYHFYIQAARDRRPKGSQDEDIAEIDSIVVYPIKSCHGVSLDSVHITRKGFEYDRRWLIVAKENLQWLSLREEPKLTFIVPSFEVSYGQDIMRLRYSKASGKTMPELDVPLDPDEEMISKWELLPPLDFYGSTAQGRVVDTIIRGSEWKGTPSEWVSKALGYPAYLLYFDKTASKRDPFPIYKPPFDIDKWSELQRQELMQYSKQTDIEFQDEYPFLISSRESLNGLNMQLEDAIASTDSPSKIDRAYWSDIGQDKNEKGIKMQSFRPNIVLRSRSELSSYPAFSEDSWETIWITNESGTLPIHLVARCKRCLLTAVDPETAHKDVNVPLGLLRKSRFRVKKAEGETGRKGPCFGMYGVPEKSSTGYASIKVGDPVRVRWRPLHLDDEVALGSRKS